jgi:hypothetical protein
MDSRLWVEADGTIVINRDPIESRYPMQFLSEEGILTASHLRIRAITSQEDTAIEEYQRIRPAVKHAVLNQLMQHSGFITAVVRKAVPAPIQSESNALIPTVLIICNSPMDAAKALLNVSTKMRIEVGAGCCKFFCTNRTSFEEEVNMGASIGVSGCLSSGTLGGYVRDVSTGARFGITNGHVVGMHLKNALEDLPLLITPESPPVNVVQNSDEDHAGTVNDAQKAMAIAATNAEQHGGMNARRNARAVTTESDYNSIKNRNRLFGSVRFGAQAVVNNSPGEIPQWKDYALIDPITGKNLSWNAASNGY